MKIQKGISKDRRLEVIVWGFKYFKHIINKDDFFAIIAQETNWNLSAILVDENDKLLGAYLLGNLQIDSIIPTNEYKNLKGVEGILLCVDETIRGQGWGNKLKDYPNILGFDYIWGQQLKSLNNLNDWLKRRVLVGQTDEVYVTLEKYVK